MTQAELADLLAITVRYLKAIENSGRKPSYDLLVRIVRELEISADAIFNSEPEEHSESGKIINFQNIT